VHTGERPFAELLPDSATWRRGELHLAGIALTDLAAEYGTPLYVYDEATLRSTARGVLETFGPLRARVSYAAKACALTGVLAVLREEGLDLDVVSAGEIEAGRRAGFRATQMHLHGNCKSDEDLLTAIRLGTHAIVADSVDELHQIDRLAGGPVSVWLRLRLPITAETHPHLQTGEGSKFGLSPGAELGAALAMVCSKSCLELRGLHTHLGSQIADPDLLRAAAEQLASRAQTLRSKGFRVAVVSVGGGWAVPYVPSDSHLPPGRVADALTVVVERNPELQLAVEPGRALVARAGIALYRVGSVKWSGGNRIIAVDGGMGDNPRPAMYGASYYVLPLKGANGRRTGPATIVGRYCESGDVLARGANLPDVIPGDLLCLPVAGAYQLSMASAYNLVPPPAAILVGADGPRPLLRGATVEDLLARDVWSAFAQKKR
jgi:diaminopimelate decarboxylase